MCSCVIKPKCLLNRDVIHFTPMFHSFLLPENLKKPLFLYPLENVSKPKVF